MVECPNILIAQVIKQYEGHRVVGIARKIYQGTKQAVAQLIKASQAKGDINTAFIERINATFRSCLSALARRTRYAAKKSAVLKSGVYLVGSVYNFCTEHESLRLPGLFGGRKHIERMPAIAAGIANYCWSVKELLCFKVPPSKWSRPKQRGHPSNALKAQIAMWNL